MIIPLSQIQIPDRFRMEYGDLAALKTSFETFGQLQTVLVVRTGEDSYKLVAGGRRLLVAKQLHIEEVECIVKENLDELTCREMEIEENIRRKDFTWPEELKYKAELLRLRQARKEPGLWEKDSPGRLTSEVAHELGESPATLSQDMELAKLMEIFPDLQKEEKKTTALRKGRQMKERIIMEVLAKELGASNPNLSIFHSDCREVLKTISDESIHLIITDPPWGVENDSDQFVKVGYSETFDDSEAATFTLLSEVLPELFRVLVSDAHMYFFFGTKWYTRVFELLSTTGFTVAPIPLIWYKKTAQNTFPQSKFAPTYETIFFCRKGTRSLSRAASAVFEFSNPDPKRHPNEKPVDLLQQFIELSSVVGETVLDPFAGVGTTAEAALRLGRKSIAVEKSEVFINHIKMLEGLKCQKPAETSTSE